MSFTSGHCLITNIIKHIEKNVVKTRTLEKGGSNLRFQVKFLGKPYLVFKNGIIIPAAVATSNNTTCKIVKTTLINLTTSARALELSMPSTVTLCNWDMCSILEICERIGLGTCVEIFM